MNNMRFLGSWRKGNYFYEQWCGDGKLLERKRLIHSAVFTDFYEV